MKTISAFAPLLLAATVMLGLLVVAASAREPSFTEDYVSMRLPLRTARQLYTCSSTSFPAGSLPLFSRDGSTVIVNNEDFFQEAEALGCAGHLVPRGSVPYIFSLGKDASPRGLSFRALPFGDQFIGLLRRSQITVFLNDERVYDPMLVTPGVRERVASRLRAPLKLPSGTLEEKADVVDYFSESVYRDVLESISGAAPLQASTGDTLIKTRFTGTEHNEIVAEYSRAHFESLGYETFLQPFVHLGTPTSNVVAIKRGRSLPDEIVVMGAHYDSTSGLPQTDAPGAIDNGSGTASVLQAAEAFANVTSSRTIYFVLFGAEEQGLIGSQYFVDVAMVDGLNIVASLIADMTGFSDKFYGLTIEGLPDAPTAELMDLMALNVVGSAPMLDYDLRYYSFGSDHVPFQSAGIPCFLAIELDDVEYPGYHSYTDTVAYLNESQAVGILRAQAATLYDIAV